MRQNAKVAQGNLTRFKRRKQDWTVLVPMFSIPALAMTLVGWTHSENQFTWLVLATALPAGLLGVSLKKALLKSPKETLLISTAETTTDEYLRVLMIEANSYGVDMTTMELRSDLLDDSLEFTALRNGNAVDIAVREFQNEVVFMMNGERLRKDTAPSAKGRRFSLALSR